MGVLGAMVAQAWLIAAAPAPDVAPVDAAPEPAAQPEPSPEPPPTPPVLTSKERAKEQANEQANGRPVDRTVPEPTPAAPDHGWPDVAAVRTELVDPWSAAPPVGAAPRPDRRSLRDPFSHRGTPRRSPAPGTVVVAQLDLQDPFARQPPMVTTAPVTSERATLDLHDPFADGEVRWDPCKVQATVDGVVVQRPRAVAEHAEAQCSRKTGPLRDPFARPAAPASPPPPPPVSPPARSV